MIRHAATSAVGALTVAMVKTPFGTALMAGPGGSNRLATTGRPARRRAVGVAAVTRRADGEGTAAVTTGSLSEGLVHGVGARGAVSDWTTNLNRGTTAGTGSVCRSSGRSRGPGGQHRVLTPRLSPLVRYPNAVPAGQRRGPWTPTLPMDAKSAPTGSLENRKERGFPQRPQPRSSPPPRSTEERVPETIRPRSVENSSVFHDR